MKPYHPGTILSTNTKCGHSINLPIAGHCRPTKNCARTCYARKGRTALPSNKKKQVWVSNYLKGLNLTELITECKKLTAVRLSGTGDLQTDHLLGIRRLARACPNTMLWGMTRKLEIARALNGKYPNLKLMVSIDSSSPAETLAYKGTLCWGPRLASDAIPDNKHIHTIFPYHNSGKIVNPKIMPHDSRDCPAVRHIVKGCSDCGGRCWSW
jgi:hypothetical protein